MKKSLFIAALALLAVGCAKQVPEIQTGQEAPISFSPIAQRVGTKANIYDGEQNTYYNGNGAIDGTDATYEEFLAEAFFTKEPSGTTNPQGTVAAADGQEFFGAKRNKHVGTYPDDYWTTWKSDGSVAEPYYWPRDGYLHFHAASPYDVSDCGSAAWSHTWASGYVLTNFTAPLYTDADADGLTATNQVDILYSDFVFNKQRGMYTPNSTAGFPYDNAGEGANYTHKGVDITFNHALAAVQFKVASDINYVQPLVDGIFEHHFKVKKIEVLNVLKTGTFTENRKNDATGDFRTTPAYTDGKVVTKVKGQTTALAAQESPYWTTIVSAPADPVTDEQNYTPFSVTSAGSMVDAAAYVLDTRSAQVGTTLLVMPQILDHNTISASLNEVEVQVTYDYTFTKNGTTYTFNNKVVKTSLAGRYAKMYNSVAEAGDGYQVNYWLINHKYIYTLVFKLDPVIFDPMVEAFVTVENINVELPYTPVP